MSDTAHSKRCLLHVGAPKCGSTSIQSYLFEMTKTGGLPGVDYQLPYPDSMDSQHLLWGLFRAPTNMPRWPLYEIERRGGIAAVMPHLEACWERIAAADNLVLSSEYLLSWSTDELDALAQRLRRAGFAYIHPLMYVRNPANFYLSLVQQHVKGAATFPSPHIFRPHYRSQIKKLTGVFGDLEMRMFDPAQLHCGCVVRDFVHRIEDLFGLELNSANLDVRNRNESLSAEAMILLQRWHRDHPERSGITATGQGIIARIRDAGRTIAQTPPELHPAVRRLIFRNSTAELARLDDFGVDFMPPERAWDDAAAEADASMDYSDVSTILQTFNPAALEALAALVLPGAPPRDIAIASPTVQPARPFVGEADGPFCLDNGGASGLWDQLLGEDMEIVMVGASVTSQRGSWADCFMAQLNAATSRQHGWGKNAMGGVGLLFGVANYKPRTPGDTRRRLVFVEFSTGDLNLGLTPPDQRRPLLVALIERALSEHSRVVFVHNWRSDFAIDDSAGVRRVYDEVARDYHIPVIANHVLIDRLIAADPGAQLRLVRDVCHTTPEGATLYARHTLACLKAMSATPCGPDPIPATASSSEEAFIRFYDVPWLPMAPPSPLVSTYVYAHTKQEFPVLEVAAQRPLVALLSGELMGVGFISGPRSGWVELRVDGRSIKNFRCFDRHSHYERYILLPAFLTLDRARVELECKAEGVDFAIAAKSHPDFACPRAMQVVHLVGRGLVFHQAP